MLLLLELLYLVAIFLFCISIFELSLSSFLYLFSLFSRLLSLLIIWSMTSPSLLSLLTSTISFLCFIKSTNSLCDVCLGFYLFCFCFNWFSLKLPTFYSDISHELNSEYFIPNNCFIYFGSTKLSFSDSKLLLKSPFLGKYIDAINVCLFLFEDIL